MRFQKRQNEDSDQKSPATKFSKVELAQIEHYDDDDFTYKIKQEQETVPRLLAFC